MGAVVTAQEYFRKYRTHCRYTAVEEEISNWMWSWKLQKQTKGPEGMAGTTLVLSHGVISVRRIVVFECVIL
jgi:hypothetical protein